MKKENKKNRIRIVSLFSVLSVVGFALTTPVNADQQCHYKDYYFFNEINTVTEINKHESDMTGAGWVRKHATYFPIATDYKNFNSGRICLRRDDNDTVACENFSGTIWNLDEFYNAYKLAATEGKSVDYTIYPTGEGTKTSTSRVKIVKDEANEITRYLTHGRWYEINADNKEIEGGDGVNLGQSKVSDMIDASLLPITAEFSSNFNSDSIITNGSIKITLDRNVIKVIPKENTEEKPFNNEIKSFSTVWHPGEAPRDSILTPALYYVEYDASCEKYQATIDYFYAGTTDRVEFKNDEANPYVETGLDNGYSKEVKSPELKGCTSSKDVTIKIDGEDFYDVVYYSCDLKEPPKTGDALIYVAWVVGLGALGYASYYLYKNRKPKEEK